MASNETLNEDLFCFLEQSKEQQHQLDKEATVNVGAA